MKKIIVAVIFLLIIIAFANTVSFLNQRKQTSQQESKKPEITLATVTSSNVKKKLSRDLFVAPIEGDVGFDRTFTHMEELNVDGVPFGLPWDEIEKAKQKYDPVWYQTMDNFYSAHKYQVTSGLMPIDTNNDRRPNDLKNQPWDYSELIDRYTKAANLIMEKTPNVTMRSFSIGNEVDVYLSQHPKEWKDYQKFFQEVVKKLKVNRPDLKIGVKMTFDGLTNKYIKETMDINQFADVILVTYYPLNDAFLVRDPKTPLDDFGKLIKLYPNKEIQVLEAGYPSSKEVGSNESKQADFMHYLFEAWDKYSDNISIISLFGIHDFSKADVNKFTAYYRLSNQRFAGYLGSLGFFTSDDKKKSCWSVIREEIRERGW